MVEFALVAVLLFTVLLGIIDFGNLYSRSIRSEQASREAVRRLSVASAPSAPTCTPSLSGANNAQLRQVVCFAVDQTGVPLGELGVAVRLSPTPASGTAPAVGGAVAVCTAFMADSLTGIFQPLMDTVAVRKRSVMRLEKVETWQAATATVDPTGGNWSWCTAS